MTKRQETRAQVGEPDRRKYLACGYKCGSTGEVNGGRYLLLDGYIGLKFGGI